MLSLEKTYRPIKDKILKAAKDVTNIKLGWYKKKTDELLDIGMVLIFDDYDRFTIDYSKEEQKIIIDECIKKDTIKGGSYPIRKVYLLHFLDHCFDQEDNSSVNDSGDFVLEITKDLKNSKYNQLEEGELKYSGNFRESLCRYYRVIKEEEIKKAAQNVKKIELGWYQKKTDELIHIGMVLIFDDDKRFTIDYSEENRKVLIFYKYSEESTYKGVLCTIENAYLSSFLDHCFKQEVNSPVYDSRGFVLEITKELDQEEKIAFENYKNLFESVCGIKTNDFDRVMEFVLNMKMSKLISWQIDHTQEL